MIKWYCNFNIPDSTVQLLEAFIKLVSYKNVNNTCVASFEIVTGEKLVSDDIVTDVVIKNYTSVYDKNCANEDEVYLEELKKYNDAEMV